MTGARDLIVYNRWVGLTGAVVLALAAPHLAIAALFASALARFVA